MKAKIATVLFIAFLTFGFLTNISGLRSAFIEENPQTQTEQGKKKPEGKAENFYTEALEGRDVIDSYYSTNINYKTGFIDLNGLALRLAGVRVVDDSQYRVVKLDDKHLSFVIPQKHNLSYPIAQTKKLSDYLKNKNIPMLYVQAPYKVCKKNPQLPAGVEDYSNEMADEFLSKLRKYGIDTLDLRDRLHEEGLNHHNLFYRTDHHWTPEAGIWATGEIANTLKEQYGFQINEKSIDINNYSCKIYKNRLLGSLGRRIGIGYDGVEDFKLYLPKFSAPMKYKIDGRKEAIDIDFSKQPFAPRHLKKDYYHMSTYCAYTDGDFLHTELYNKKDKTGQKVLIIRESFATVVSPFLGLSCDRLDTVDLRYEGSEAKSFIDAMNPDYVVILYNPNTLTSDKAFDFILEK